ncbi:putative nucleoside-diphosphate-sugar epimerase [Rosellinia necatrix]|uniref:Putative nucleoside-diphosphate-sugar epimerase n=1 Tax=Rosellinia necatrix TaxID=77044 RepID=A0A1S8A8A2_ROSNE|nr:putative nucleoside-diphosphate-sugar epimerase [Rosellinia necatrix]
MAVLTAPPCAASTTLSTWRWKASSGRRVRASTPPRSSKTRSDGSPSRPAVVSKCVKIPFPPVCSQYPGRPVGACPAASPAAMARAAPSWSDASAASIAVFGGGVSPQALVIGPGGLAAQQRGVVEGADDDADVRVRGADPGGAVLGSRERRVLELRVLARERVQRVAGDVPRDTGPSFCIAPRPPRVR